MSKSLSADELARMLGLSKWQIGSHPAALGHGPASARYLWSVCAAPSFDYGWYLAAVWGHDEGVAVPEPWLRVAFARGAEYVTATLTEDPLVAVVNRVELFPVPGRGAADGISYSVSVEGWDVSGRFRFSNPEAPELIAVEAAAFTLAEQITPGDSPLRQVVEDWRTYTVAGRRKR